MAFLTTMSSKEEASSLGLTEWSVWCDLRDENDRTVGSVYGANTPEENEATAKRFAEAINAHDELVATLRWVRANYASGPTAEINARIDAALSKVQP